MTVPNFFTVLRLSFIPLFVVAFYLPFDWRYTASVLVFTLAALTDWLDGFLARALKQETAFGRFLDPVADKLIVVVALLLLVERFATPWLALPAVVIVCREIVISALREWMAEMGKQSTLAVSFLGKVKTFIQMMAIILLLSQPPHTDAFINQRIIWVGYSLLYLAVGLTLGSLFSYIRLAHKDLKR